MKNVLILIFLAFCIVANAQIIDFPDVNFKNTLVNSKCVDTNGDGLGDFDADLNNDGEIDVNEALKVERLNVSSSNIESLKGIDFFYDLTMLNCAYNKLTILDLQSMVNLNYLFCMDNDLKTLHVQGLNKLIYLYCYRNDLTSLNTKGLINLIYLLCMENKFTTLNVGNMSKLYSLNCNKNNLTSLFIKTGN